METGSTVVGYWLADLDTTVNGLAKGKLVVVWRKCQRKKEKDGLWKVGDFDVWREFRDLESATQGSPD